jgi:hypothetical protein
VNNDPNLAAGQKLTVGLLDLLQLANEVPEATARNILIGCKDIHLVHRGVGVFLSWLTAANNLKLLHLRRHTRRFKEEING